MNLRSILKERGITQAELAKLSGLSQSTISGILSGASKPKAENLRRIADVLSLGIEELKKSPASLTCCPRCGSRAITQWQNLADGSCRVLCGYCGLDSGEQHSMEKAVEIMESFRPSVKKSEENYTRVLTLPELLDSAYMDGEAVRPVWFENRGLFIIPALLQCGTAERELGLVHVLWFGSVSPKSYLFNLYGSTWRAWSSKPTEPQSDAEPWKD